MDNEITDRKCTQETSSNSQRLQHALQQSPATFNRFNLHTFTWRMRAAYVRAKGNHVQMRVAGGEQAAFKPCMDHLQAGRFAVLHGINTLAQREQI